MPATSTKFCFALLLTFLACSSPTINAQLLTYKTISTDDGLPSNQINIILQDSKGYVWMGTKNGLCRWDSKKFEYFTIAEGLPNNEVLYLCEDAAGRIWVSTLSQELCFIYKDRIYNRNNTPFLNKVRNYAGSVFLVYGNKLYFNMSGAKLFKFDLSTLELSEFYGYCPAQFNFIEYKGKVWGIQQERSRALLLSKAFKTLVVREDTSYYAENYLVPNVSNKFLACIDFKNKIYSFQFGLDAPFYKASYSDKNLQTAFYNDGKVLEVYKDYVVQKKDNYKIKGDFSASPQVFAIKQAFFMPMVEGLLFCPQIPVLKYDHNQQINNNDRFIFKHENELYAVNNKYQLIDIPKQKKINRLNSNAINLYNLLKFENKYYLTTSYNVYRFTNPNKNIDDSHEIEIGNFKYISPSKKTGYFFVASGVTRNISLVNFQNWIHDTLMKDTLQSVYSVFEDSQSRLWYSTTNKVYYTNEYYHGIKNSKEFILDVKSSIFCKGIQEDNKGNLFFVTNGGVFIFDGKRKYRIDKTNLLSDNECNKVLIDTLHKSFWVATKNGLNQIGYSQEDGGLKFEIFSKFFTTDGLRSDNINDLLLDSNKLYIATDKGVNILDNVRYRPDTTSIPIYIKLKAINSASSKVNDTLNNIELQHNQNNLTITFSALYFLRRDRLKTKAYLYRNNSLISQSEITEDKIDYYSLNDGKYKLIIYAYDQDYHYIQGKSVPFTFIINPPYYKTWWFIVGSSLVVIVITMSIALWSINRRKKRAIQQAELQAKLNESTLKSLQSQMNPHFVFNSLNTIQSFITEKNEEGAIDYLSDFSGLMREILEQSVHSFISLENEIHFLEHYVKLEMTRYKDSFDVVWDIDLQEEDLTDIYIPTMLIQPILENAVKHGVSNLLNTKGHINITFELVRENLLKVTVKDNGKLSSKGSFKGNSIAVQTIKDRLNIYTKNNEKGTYTLQVSDEGAIATITIPI